MPLPCGTHEKLRLNNAKALVERKMSPAEHSLSSEKLFTNETLVPAEADAAALTSCQNCGKIKKKAKFNGGCDPAKSKGYRSSHNCKNAGGKSYLCVRDGVAHCYKGNLANLAMEHGECFL